MCPFPEELRLYNIRARAVLLDLEFTFPDDNQTTAKWIIVLCDHLIEGDIIFTLTTSQTGTYSGSFRHYIEVQKDDEPCFEKDCVIEIERTHPAEVARLIEKCKTGTIKHKGFISERLLREIFDKIAECSTIYEYIKEGLGVYE